MLTHNNENNNFIKSLVRGKINKGSIEVGAHHPNDIDNPCDSEGNIVDGELDSDPFNYKKAFIRHYCTKSAEEYVRKLIKFSGDMNVKEFKEYALEKIKYVFFKYNKITNEKIEIFEKKLDVNLEELKVSYYMGNYYFDDYFVDNDNEHYNYVDDQFADQDQ